MYNVSTVSLYINLLSNILKNKAKIDDVKTARDHNRT